MNTSIIKYKNKKLYLAPYNDLTDKLAGRLANEQVEVEGFFDLSKRAHNIFSYEHQCQFDYVVISSPNYWSAIANNFPKEKVLIHHGQNDRFTPLEEYLKEMGRESYYDVLLIPFNKSNTTDLALVARELSGLGLTAALVNIGADRDSNLGEGLKLNSDVRQIDRANLESVSKKAVVVSIDWEKSFGRPYILSEREKGVLTVGIVDGIEDFDDTDYGYQRHAYQTVEYVLTMGSDDLKHLDNKRDKACVVGLPKLYDLYRESRFFPEQDRVVINVNFTYGSFEEVREDWVNDVISACQQLGLDFVISQHHADSGDFSDYPVSPLNIYNCVRQGSIVISRFSTVVLESLALGKPVVYYNPHGEKVPIYQNPQGAFSYSTNIETLKEYIGKELENKGNVRERASAFLNRKCNISSEVAPSKLAAYRIKNLIEEKDKIALDALKTFSLSKSYVSRCEYHHYDDSDCEDEWQLEVYLHALGLMKTHGFSKVADFGCGSGYKLIKYLGDYKSVGYELPVNVDILQSKYPEHQWRVSDFSKKNDIDVDVLICSDVIEHLIDPDDLINYFQNQSFKYLIISTPERELCYTAGEPYNQGPPRNKAHQREWNFAEFKQYISKSFEILDHRVTNLHQGTQMMICKKRSEDLVQKKN